MAHCVKGCCSQHKEEHNHGENHNHDHNHNQTISNPAIIKEFTVSGVSFIVLFVGIVMDYLNVSFFTTNLIPVNLNGFTFDFNFVQFIWYGIPFLAVGAPVIRDAIYLMRKKDFFNELSLMSIATLGAIAIGEYAEGLGVMVFYNIGEVIQGMAVSKAKGNIKALLDVRPDVAYVVRNNEVTTVKPEEVSIGEVIEIRTGEKVPLDGTMITEKASFNTAALTGESIPRTIRTEESVLAGMLSSEKTVRIEVTKLYEDSTLARILKMVQDAAENKSPTEQFIRKFARVYTPLVFVLAVLVVIIPIFLLGSEYVFIDWFYRALIFLVISCPCALVISVPLGYFGGIGLGSHNGILFKGGNFLEAITNLKTLVTDKTGTITKGIFTVQEIIADDESLLLTNLASIEKHSTHPIAKAILNYTIDQNIKAVEVDDVFEVAGYGLKGSIDGKILLAGNIKLLDQAQITVPDHLRNIVRTAVFVALDNKFLGAVIVADEIKEDTPMAIEQLHKLGVNVIMLSGDKKAIVSEIAETLNIDEAHGELLPDGKAQFFEKIKKQNPNNIIAFVGDGINDAPVLALSDVGIAMGGLGSDLAIETADIIIQTDEPNKIPLAVLVGKATRKVVVQNIVLAMSVKIIILILGINGLASMWEAIFADVGVSLIATFNSSRLLYKKFDTFN